MGNKIVHWNPFREMTTMQDMMDRFFEDRWRPFFEDDLMSFGGRTLSLDIHEDDDNYTVTTELPGVKVDDIHVRLDGDSLIIEGEIQGEDTEKEGTQVLVQERRYGRYCRRVRLPQTIDSDKVEARYEDGILTLTLPKMEETKPHTIPITVTKK